MQLGMIGLGRMGANMVRRLMRNGHSCVVFDLNPENVEALVAEGAVGASSLEDFAATEGVDMDELAELVKEAVSGGRTSVNKSLGLLVAAGDYSKFVSLMAQKAKEPPRVESPF